MIHALSLSSALQFPYFFEDRAIVALYWSIGVMAIVLTIFGAVKVRLLSTVDHLVAPFLTSRPLLLSGLLHGRQDRSERVPQGLSLDDHCRWRRGSGKLAHRQSSGEAVESWVDPSPACCKRGLALLIHLPLTLLFCIVPHRFGPEQEQRRPHLRTLARRIAVIE